MWTRFFLPAIAVACMAGTSPLSSAQEVGQYRSHILLDPEGQLGSANALSTEQLEQQIDSISEPYARSSATRHLARHYVEQKDYQAAINWYQQALAADGLSAVANREMLRELAQVLLLQQDYKRAATVLEQVSTLDLVPETGDFLLLAQAYFRSGDLVAVVAALDQIPQHQLTMDTIQKKQALALYYRAGAFEQCEQLLRELLQEAPGEAALWHQLASIYLQQGKRRAAQDQLVLALEKQVPFNSEQMRLLLDLFAVNGNPYQAAILLEQALETQLIPTDSSNQRKLFELWLQARERSKALHALAEAVRLGGETELSLYLAQLQIEDDNWAAAQQTLLAACRNVLPDRYVSRANLLLGISLLKLDQPTAARRALINATLIGGASAEAAQWLQFMAAEPATKDELRQVRGPCYDSDGKRTSLAASTPKNTLTTLPAEPDSGSVSPDQGLPAPVTIDQDPPQSLYYTTTDKPLEAFLAEVPAAAARLSINLIKAGGSANGPLQIILLPEEPLRLAQPTRGAPQARGRYQLQPVPSFHYASTQLPITNGSAMDLAQQFADRVQAQRYELTGERRLLLIPGDQQHVELRLGIHQESSQ